MCQAMSTTNARIKIKFGVLVYFFVVACTPFSFFCFFKLNYQAINPIINIKFIKIQFKSKRASGYPKFFSTRTEKFVIIHTRMYSSLWTTNLNISRFSRNSPGRTKLHVKKVSKYEISLLWSISPVNPPTKNTTAVGHTKVYTTNRT